MHPSGAPHPSKSAEDGKVAEKSDGDQWLRAPWPGPMKTLEDLCSWEALMEEPFPAAPLPPIVFQWNKTNVVSGYLVGDDLNRYMLQALKTHSML